MFHARPGDDLPLNLNRGWHPRRSRAGRRRMKNCVPCHTGIWNTGHCRCQRLVGCASSAKACNEDEPQVSKTAQVCHVTSPILCSQAQVQGQIVTRPSKVTSALQDLFATALIPGFRRGPRDDAPPLQGPGRRPDDQKKKRAEVPRRVDEHFRCGNSLHHAAHATHATHSTHATHAAAAAGRSLGLLLGNLGNRRFGGQ